VKRHGVEGHYVYRSSVTGEYVSWLYAMFHPSTTVREWVPGPKPPPMP